MAAARDGAVEIHADGSVTLAGVTLAPDEVEIQATPRPGTAVAHDEGLVVVIDTELTPELRAEGDARELQRAIQDLRKEAGLELDDRIELWVDGLPRRPRPHLAAVAAETLADDVGATAPADARAGASPRGGAVGSRCRNGADSARRRRRIRRVADAGATEAADGDAVAIAIAVPQRGRSASRRPGDRPLAGLPRSRRAIVVADQLTKAWMSRNVAPGVGLDRRRLPAARPLQNNGALFGLFRERRSCSGSPRSIVIGLIVVYHAPGRPKPYMSVALGLLLGGAIGNLIDRLRLRLCRRLRRLGIGDVRWFTPSTSPMRRSASRSCS